MTDIRSPTDGVVAAFWLALMLASVAAVTWAVLVYNDARLPRVGDLQFFVNVSLENARAGNMQLRSISWNALIGEVLAVASVLAIIGVIHLILKGESKLYNDLASRMLCRPKRASG